MDITKIDSAILAMTPAVAPPPDTVSNFKTPDSLDRLARLTVYIALPITFVPVAMRFYTRARITRSWGADDYLIIVSLICVIAFSVLFLIIIDGPMGEHTWDVPVSRIKISYSKANLASQCLYALSALFVKVTLLVFYLRIFSPVPYTRIMIWAGIAFTVIIYVGTSIATIILYTPKSGGDMGWMAPKPDSVAEALMTVPSAQGIIGVVTDFYILCIPIHLVVRLHLPLGRKIGVCGIFLTGLIACVCAIVGTVFRFKAKPSRDPLWMTVPAYSLAVIELCAGIACCCLPVLLVLFKHIAKNESYISLVRHLRTRMTRKTSHEPSAEKKEKSMSVGRIVLKIPRPVMTGLRSFVRRNGGSKAETSPTTMGSHGDLESVNDDYHVQLKNIQSKK